jgi:hypothetical protein
VLGYSGSGDGVDTDLTAFISDEMRADWEANCEELMACWRSDKTEADVLPDVLGGSADMLPWAAVQLAS